MAETLFTQKVGDLTFKMMMAPGFHNNSEIALFVEGSEEPIVIMSITDRKHDTIVVKPTKTSMVRIKVPSKSVPGAPAKAPTLSDVR